MLELSENIQQILISVIIVVTLIAFLKSKMRNDVIALMALFSVAVLGLLPIDRIFEGFIHPTIILVVSMIAMSRAMITSGIVDYAAKYMKFGEHHPALQLTALVSFTAILSAFINGLGALAFVIPIAIRMARQSGTSLSMFLMPIAFAAHFGGISTLIGSTNNIIVSGFRSENIGEQFGFFAFAPVAIPIALCGVAFISLIGWRLLPRREDTLGSNNESAVFDAELRITEGSKFAGKTINDLKSSAHEDLHIIAIERGETFIDAPRDEMTLYQNDIIQIELEPSLLEEINTTLGLELLNKKPTDDSPKDTPDIQEVIIQNNSLLIGETAKSLGLRTNHHVNLLALHGDEGKRQSRLGDALLKEGDILIIQGAQDRLSRFNKRFNVLLLKERDFHLEGKSRSAITTGAIFVSAILVSVLSIAPIHIIFAAAALIVIAIGYVPMKEMYNSMDLSMLVLIAVLISLSIVFHDTGATESLGNIILGFSDNISPQLALAIIFAATMWLSDIMSDAAVAIFFAPVALSIAFGLGVSPDPFLMAVAIGAGSSYLLPIGHQSNLFVMNLGGYKFSDYWKIGLPLELITFAVGFPLILRYFPF